MKKPRRRSSQIAFSRGRGRSRSSNHTDQDVLHSPSPCRLNFSMSRDTLTYAQSRKMVEVELEGRVHRINVSDPLQVITEDELLAHDLAECNSNKENSEQIASYAQWDHMVSPSKDRRKDCKHSGRNRRSGGQHYSHNHLSSAHHAHIVSPLPKPTFHRVETYSPSEAHPLPVAYYRYVEKSSEELEMEAEYDMDEEDMAWLEMVNQKRVSDGHASVSPDTFELLIDRLERESILESRSQALSQNSIDEDAFCCVCLDDECLNSNAILFCDICNLAVHQECYGVPYIPEGQWLCRRCLQSPSRPVDCVLCPNRGGAFKQASDGRWAHVVCAIWIPEVCFANTVFLEPVEGVNNIPPARWKLTCYLCKQRGRGASIQCHKANCYRAFHVTCAQRAGLFMKIDPVRETGTNNTTFTVKKTAFCGNHSPLGAQVGYSEECGSFAGGRGQRSYTLGPTVQHKQHGNKKALVPQQKKKTRKNADGVSRKSAVPLLLVPQIPSYRLNKICTGVPVQRKNQFMQRLHNYWLLKRHSRNGVPLIHQLHSHLQVQKIEQREPDAKVQALRVELTYWQKQRQDLEKARLLIELIRKRERLKREQLKLQQVTLELQLTPALVLLRSTLEQLQEKDTGCIFVSPVNLSEVPDYLQFVSEPMDFSTMREKLEAHKYCSVADLEADFNLMVSNCLRYNSSDTVFHKAAMQLKKVGGAILRHAQRQALSTGFDLSTGMHLPDSANKVNSSQSCWDRGLTNGLKKQNKSESCSTAYQNISSSPPKCSQGKPSLNKVPVGEGENAKRYSETNLEPFSLVWAKCRGYPSYPAMMVDPDMPKERILPNGFVTPVPPQEVLKLGERRQMKTEDKLFLVLFFDTKRTWQWLPMGKLHPMGNDDSVDKLRLMEGKKPNVRKSVHMAYERAMRHLSHARENIIYSPPPFIQSTSL